MNGDTNAKHAAGLEPVHPRNAVDHAARLGLEGALDRAADLVREALSQGFGNGEAHVALLRQALDVLKASQSGR